jgi:outer membrane protein TolC
MGRHRHSTAVVLRRILAPVIGALLLAGCKTFSPDGGMSVVADVAGRHLNKDVAAIRTPQAAEEARGRVEQLLRRPLAADAAVQIALLNNRGLQAAYNALGIAEAEMIQASLPPTPTISIERMASPLELELERRIVGNILALATLPARASIAADRFEQAKLRAAEETLRVAAEARRSYYRAVAAREMAVFLDQSKSAAETATRLAKRLGETGAMNKLDQAREQTFYAEVTAQLGLARKRAASERERLVRWLGLWGQELDFKLPASLPPLPARVRPLPDIEVEAVRRRVDLQIARIELDALAKSYGLTQASRFVNLIELAGIRKTKTERTSGEKERTRGIEAELQIPIFDLGESRVRMAEESYRQAVNRLAEKAINARSEAREAYRAYRAAFDIARHYRNELLPLRKIISDETLLRYNAMLIDVFALLTEARQRIAVTNQAIEAHREFWLSAVDLGVAVTGGGVAGPGEGMQAVAAAPGGEAGH